MQVKDVMTPRVVSVEPTASIETAARLMLARHISGLPVVERDGTLVGMVTEGDFLRRAEIGTEQRRSGWLAFLAGSGRMAADYVQTHSRRVEEVMTRGAVTASPEDTLEAAVGTMVQRRVKRLPVLENGRLVGIVARSDVLRAFARRSPIHHGTHASDEELRAAVMAELGRESWARNGLIRVEVEDGTVELNGTILDERQRAAARVVAENVPGVRKVVDKLVWIEPMSGMVVLPPEAETRPGGGRG